MQSVNMQGLSTLVQKQLWFDIYPEKTRQG